MTATPLDALVDHLDSVIHDTSLAAGQDPETIRAQLMLKWESARLRAAAECRSAQLNTLDSILNQAYASLQAGDIEGYKTQCWAWLSAAHGVAGGDAVVLNGWFKQRTVRIQDIDLNAGLEGMSSVTIIGPCLSHRIRNSTPDRHTQLLTDGIRKTTA